MQASFAEYHNKCRYTVSDIHPYILAAPEGSLPILDSDSFHILAVVLLVWRASLLQVLSTLQYVYHASLEPSAIQVVRILDRVFRVCKH